MPNDVFECPTPKCGNTIAAEGLNKIQLQALRRWPKTCTRCGKIARWVEKLSMLSGVETKTIKKNGGSKNAQADTGHYH
jgi:ssDNA-binding Zn-finger/Zn-ribbon topoisomerase 1